MQPATTAGRLAVVRSEAKGLAADPYGELPGVLK